MKFPEVSIDRQSYLTHIFKLLTNEDCKIFIDTNILSILYKINGSSRKELYEWFNLLIGQNRIKTPIWAAQEYTSHFIDDKINEYLSALQSLKKVNKEFELIKDFLKMYVDQDILKGSKYTSITDFNSDLDDIGNKLKYITNATKSNNFNETIHNEIKAFLEKTILKSDLRKILRETKKTAEIRYQHRIPPGHKDGDKEFNKYGDLILWTEILNYCKRSQTKKAILITNDNKKDWVYAPNKIHDGLKLVPNRDSFKIADPRLVYEFYLNTTSNEFHIINFETLINILVFNYPGNFLGLARSLQVATSSEEPKLIIDYNHIIEGELIIDLKSSSNPIIDDQQSSSYSMNALADANFTFARETKLNSIILRLKSYNWYVQNPAIDELFKLDLNSLERTSETRDELFVTGRNIYQSACGGSISATSTLNNLNEIFAKYDEYVFTHLYSGMMYEVYFNSHNLFRENKFKSTYFNEVFKISSVSKAKESIDFINQKLQPYSNKLLFTPGQSFNNYEIKIEYDEIEDTSLDFLGIKSIYHSINNININNATIFTSNPDLQQMGSFFYGEWNAQELLKFISINYVIPLQYMKMVYESHFSDKTLFRMRPDLRLKNLSDINS